MGNFGIFVWVGLSKFFVIEVDEYDFVFFDKWLKFVYYLLRILIINNIEFDYVDIFENLYVI